MKERLHNTVILLWWCYNYNRFCNKDYSDHNNKVLKVIKMFHLFRSSYRLTIMK